MESEKLMCGICRNDTKHDVIRSYVRRMNLDNGPDKAPDWGEVTYEMLECRGCEDVSFRERWSSNRDLDAETGQPIVSERLYPQRGREGLVERQFLNAPYHVQRVYRESVGAFNYDLNLLCAVGVRTLVETICAACKVVSGDVPNLDAAGKAVKDTAGNPTAHNSRNLEGKIYGLAQQGHLTMMHADALHGHRFLGNKAVHEFRPPVARCDRDSGTHIGEPL